MHALERIFGKKPLLPELTAQQREFMGYRRGVEMFLLDGRSLMDTARWLLTAGKPLEASILLDALERSFLGLDDDLRGRQAADGDIPPPPTLMCAQGADSSENRLALAATSLARLEEWSRSLVAGLRTPEDEYEARRKAWLRRRILAACCILGLAALLVASGVKGYASLRESFVIPTDMLAKSPPPGFEIGGLGPVEKLTHEDYRWGMGPKTVLAFLSKGAFALELRLNWKNLISGQTATIRLNGQDVERLGPLTEGESGQRVLRFESREGLNVLELDYGLWNFHGAYIAPTDPRPFALQIQEFSLRRQSVW